jgi:hypothetical protein
MLGVMDAPRSLITADEFFATPGRDRAELIRGAPRVRSFPVAPTAV